MTNEFNSLCVNLKTKQMNEIRTTQNERDFNETLLSLKNRRNEVVKLVLFDRWTIYNFYKYSQTFSRLFIAEISSSDVVGGHRCCGFVCLFVVVLKFGTKRMKIYDVYFVVDNIFHFHFHFLLHLLTLINIIFLNLFLVCFEFRPNVFSKIVELEEELRVVGNNLKSLEVSEEKALQREDSYEDQIRTVTTRLKEVSKDFLFVFFIFLYIFF